MKFSENYFCVPPRFCDKHFGILFKIICFLWQSPQIKFGIYAHYTEISLFIFIDIIKYTGGRGSMAQYMQRNSYILHLLTKWVEIMMKKQNLTALLRSTFANQLTNRYHNSHSIGVKLHAQRVIQLLHKI